MKSLASLLLLGSLASAFNPREYTKKSATCKALKRDEGSKQVDINISYVDINPSAKHTLLMVHGWPGLWSTWARQIDAFKDDYHLIVVDQRGFGESTHPGDVKSSGTMYDIASDLSCVLEHANVESATCVGHDWGAQVCYESVRLRPDIYDAVIGVTVPYIPAHGPFVPIKHLVSQLPKLSYQLFFDLKTSDAVKELDTDVRRSLRGTLRSKSSPTPDAFLRSTESFVGGWDGVEEIPPMPFFSEEEEDYIVEQYKIQGFRNTLQFYTQENREASWKLANEQGNHSIPLPALAIFPTHDPVADWQIASKLLHSAEFLPHLTTEMVQGAHWVHIENPEPVNEVMKKWLGDVYTDNEKGETGARDEL